jgi:small-conductance mechanosensitive channel
MLKKVYLLAEPWLVSVQKPDFWWQVALIIVAALVASLLNRRMHVVLERTQLGSTGFKHLAIRSAQRLLWPLSALLLLLPARAALDYYTLPTQLLQLIMPILLALAVVRFSVYALRKAFTVNPLLKSSEHLLVMLVWFLVILHLMGWLPLLTEMLDSMAVSLGETRISVLSTIKLLLMAGVAFTLAVWLSEVIASQLRKSAHISPSMQVGVSKFTKFLLITLAFLIALNAVGVNLGSLAVFGGALGVGLGFGLQRIASNFISGFILVMDRSIKPGDVITVGDQFGWVEELNARYVVVRNREGVDTLIPNENLITSEVINWSYADRNVRLSIPVQISYKDDPEQAMALLLTCAHASPRVLQEPPPFVRLMQFGDNGIELQLRVWIGDPENGFANVRSDINIALWRAFKQAGITIPYPQRDLHIKSMPEGLKV